jgi:hypothetical protein
MISKNTWSIMELSSLSFLSMSHKMNRKNAGYTELNHQKNIGDFQLVMCGQEVFGMIT